MSAKIKATAVVFVKGGIIGVANIIPGVSGGTLAVVLGLYDRLIEAIANFLGKPEKRKEYFLFLTTLFLGAGAAIVLLANVMSYLLTNHYHVTVFAFMGLILGGVPSLWRAHSDMRVHMPRIAAFLAGVILVVIPACMGSGAGAAVMTSESGVPAFGWLGYAFLIFAGFMAGGGMIVPGVSGSFILVLMGQYAMIISAIKGFAVTPLLCVAFGAAVGILVFSKIMEACLKKAPANTYYFILGLVVASLWAVFPGMPASAPALFAGGAVLLTGAGVSYLMSKISV